MISLRRNRSSASAADALVVSEELVQAGRRLEAIDVLVHALKAVHQDLQQEKLQRQVVETRLKKTEASLARLTRVVDALRRQGWVQ